MESSVSDGVSRADELKRRVKTIRPEIKMTPELQAAIDSQMLHKRRIRFPIVRFARWYERKTLPTLMNPYRLWFVLVVGVVPAVVLAYRRWIFGPGYPLNRYMYMRQKAAGTIPDAYAANERDYMRLAMKYSTQVPYEQRVKYGFTPENFAQIEEALVPAIVAEDRMQADISQQRST